MAGVTATTQGSSVATAFGVRRAQHGWLAGGALLVIAALVALLLAVQSGPNVRAAAVPPPGLVQDNRVIDPATQPTFFRGRPY
jgi:hypothetical protein